MQHHLSNINQYLIMDLFILVPENSVLNYSCIVCYKQTSKHFNELSNVTWCPDSFKNL